MISKTNIMCGGFAEWRKREEKQMPLKTEDNHHDAVFGIAVPASNKGDTSYDNLT